MADTTQQYSIIDNKNAHEIYANQFISAGFDGGSVTITLGTSHLLPEKMGQSMADGAQPAVYVTGRLALSAAAAVELVTNITGMLERIGLMGKNRGNFKQ